MVMKTHEILAQMLDILRRETELYQAISEVMDTERDAALQSNLIDLNQAGIEKDWDCLKSSDVTFYPIWQTCWDIRTGS
jgi:hypothetical protein